MAEIFYSDKQKIFECNIEVEGASINDSSARLRLDFDDGINYLFEGKIGTGGKCRIKVPPLKHASADAGIVTLEVITEETFFEPWRSDFGIKRSKKVTVEVMTEEEQKQEHRPKVIVMKESSKKKVSLSDIIREDISAKDKEIILETVKSYKNLTKEQRKSWDMLIETHKPSLKTIKSAKKLFTDINLPIPRVYMYFIDSI